MPRHHNPITGGTILKGLLIAGGVYGGVKLIKGKKKRPVAKKPVVTEPTPENYQEIMEASTLSFVIADRQYKYEEGILVRPAVLLAGPNKGYVKAKAELNPEVDFIWTTKQVIAGMQTDAKVSPLPVTITWAFPIANILAGRWIKETRPGSTDLNAEQINTAIELAKTGDVPAPPGIDNGGIPIPSPTPPVPQESPL